MGERALAYLQVFTRTFQIAAGAMTLIAGLTGLYLSFAHSAVTGVLSFFMPPANFIVGATKILTGLNIYDLISKL
jgi:hypothetical protein